MNVASWPWARSHNTKPINLIVPPIGRRNIIVFAWISYFSFVIFLPETMASNLRSRSHEYSSLPVHYNDDIPLREVGSSSKKKIFSAYEDKRTVHPWWMAALVALFLILVFGFESSTRLDGSPNNEPYYETSPEPLYGDNFSSSYHQKKRYSENRFTSWGPGRRAKSENPSVTGGWRPKKRPHGW